MFDSLNENIISNKFQYSMKVEMEFGFSDANLLTENQNNNLFLFQLTWGLSAGSGLSSSQSLVKCTHEPFYFSLLISAPSALYTYNPHAS